MCHGLGRAEPVAHDVPTLVFQREPLLSGVQSRGGGLGRKTARLGCNDRSQAAGNGQSSDANARRRTHVGRTSDGVRTQNAAYDCRPKLLSPFEFRCNTKSFGRIGRKIPEHIIGREGPIGPASQRTTMRGWVPVRLGPSSIAVLNKGGICCVPTHSFAW